MQSESRDEWLVAESLTALGFQVTRVPTGRKRSCDFTVSDSQSRYLVEVKGRTDPNELWTTLQQDETYESGRDLCRSNRIQDVVDGAMKQLTETRRTRFAEFMLTALVVRPVLSRDAEFRRVMATLYGTQELLEFGADFKSRTTYTCLYFDESSFFRHEELNAALVFVGSEKWTLCVNDFASNAAEFRKSQMYRQFIKARAIFDPASATRDQGYLVADFDVSRSDRGSMQREICRRYGLQNVIPFNPIEWTGAVAIPKVGNRT